MVMDASCADSVRGGVEALCKHDSVRACVAHVRPRLVIISTRVSAR
jgi:hypothetical protein